MKFEEARGLYQELTINMGKCDIYWEDEFTTLIYSTVIRSMSRFLGLQKSKEVPVSLVTQDLKGNFILAGIVKYHANENEDMPGNWTYEISINEEDIKGTNQFLISDETFKAILESVMRQQFRVRVNFGTLIVTMVSVSMDTLVEWLKRNTEAGIEIEMEGLFSASAVIEDGEPCISIVPAGEMNTTIKDDAVL